MLHREPVDQFATGGRRGRRDHDETSVRLRREGIDGALQLSVITIGCADRLYGKGFRCRIDYAEVLIVDDAGLKDERDTSDARHRFLEQLQPFATERLVKIRDPGGIALRPRDVLQKPKSDGITNIGED